MFNHNKISSCRVEAEQTELPRESCTMQSIIERFSTKKVQLMLTGWTEDKQVEQKT